SRAQFRSAEWKGATSTPVPDYPPLISLSPPLFGSFDLSFLFGHNLAARLTNLLFRIICSLTPLGNKTKREARIRIKKQIDAILEMVSPLLQPVNIASPIRFSLSPPDFVIECGRVHTFVAEKK
ncbi:hypothetical protein PFISCL1PPCAC_22738, partial [Pristionchus fissidentatus]